jgi:hypothetical protein
VVIASKISRLYGRKGHHRVNIALTPAERPYDSSVTTPPRARALAELDAAAHVPGWLAACIEADAVAGRFADWGSSTVVDENTGEPVIGEGFFAELHAAAGLPCAWPVGNAGLLHVYGYLLSRVETPYGRKRDRWVDGGVARALGLPAEAFTPWFAGGSTPLERLTRAAAPLVDAHPESDSRILFRYDETPGGLAARTVVVRDSGSGTTALLYLVGGADALRLVTLFPVEGFDDAWAARLLREPARLRYNAAG